MSPPADERRYIRAVESAWSRLLGRPALLSPREFETIDAWRRRGIPLTVVLEVVADAGKRGVGSSPRALTALARAVEDAWAVVASGRATQDRSGVLPPRSDARRAWEACLERCAADTPMHALLVDLLRQEATGASGPVLDAALDRALPGALPADTLLRATDATVRELEAFRERMSEQEFQSLLQRALVDRLRAALGLPRLALTR